MDNRSAWKMAFELGWPSFWPTVLYGAIVIAPFAVLVMFSGEANLPFSFALFFLALAYLFWKFLFAYMSDGMRLAPDVFKSTVLPLLLGKAPSEERIKNGKALRKATWEMLRERFTAFSLAALAGSIFISAVKQPLAATIYLPLWLLIDTFFLKQMILRKKKRAAATEVTDSQLKAFLAFDRWQGKTAAERVKFAVVKPVMLFLLLWVAWPLSGGAITFAQSAEITAFFNEAVKEPEADRNGVYAILGLGATEEDLHQAGFVVAGELEKGATLTPLSAVYPEGAAPLCRLYAPVKEGEKCLKLSEVSKVLAANRALLDRYEQLYRFEAFAWPKTLIASTGMGYEDAYLAGFTDLGLLKVMSYAQLAHKGQAEAALKEWLYHTAFLAKLLAARDSLRAYASHKLVYTEAMAALPYILSKDAKLAKKYYDGIKKSFAYLGARDIDMVQIIRNEATLISWSAEKQVDGIVKSLIPQHAPDWLRRAYGIAFGGSVKVLDNKLYWQMREMEQLARGSVGDSKEFRLLMERAVARYSTRNGRLLHGVADLAKPHIGAVTNILVSGMPSAYEKILFDFADFNRQRMLMAHLEAERKDVAPAAMDGFLKDTVPTLNPQLVAFETRQPFYWDEEKAKICYDDPPPDEGQGEKPAAPGPAVTHCLETKPFVE